MLKKARQLPLFSFSMLMFIASIAAADVSDKRLQALQHLIKHDCGSCHGMTLKGGLGPPLQAASLKDKSDELLFVTISEGRDGTPMPPWKSLLSKADINSIITILRNGENK